ncbi:lipid IV(A) 3-deoxy-D-manno-octulosonic acid transferase [Sansalvadorimonas sp. 2012CJ34-2]|uniref:3-deoxy-D-manno-octulosonic acid transferase n=1 Tax=Parendozoicomonas callyspongiae TaxID=2942213 RepID=A0ABT0PLK5_9GAMM|nr:lipid IV(A) 3-deoxy-D-manno-octulosonic acid transferase [Sansalvadorimonas sp. 2012CJ34-2]MCL6272136.1 lipid IV(A) 3-deoxy-D-manno-octulosonic acid transferase [Sansalvadorimonas sp. 2012CJ34-2]
MSRLFYTLIFYLGLPLIVLRLLYRAWKAPAYAKRWSERFGFFTGPSDSQKSIWVHTVSVGESIAAAPLVRKLMEACPDHRIVVTTMTPTGSEQVKKLYGDSMFHVYAPYDLPGSVSRFLNKIQPELAIFMETELWPNTVAACHKRNIPTLLTNARLSERSARGYQRISSLSRNMLTKLSFIAAQTEDDARRFTELGFPKARMKVTGTLKYDIAVSQELRTEGQSLRVQWLSGRPEHARIFIAASTHKGEDEQVIEAFQSVRDSLPDTLLILVPRHPERFNPVYEQLSGGGLQVSRRSTNDPVTPETDVLLGDTMGELMRMFAASDIAFVGGSLVEHGGHNPLEPAALGLPTIMGPHVFNFAEVVQTMEQAGALATVHTAAGLARQTAYLLADREACLEVGKAATEVMDRNRGALDQQLMLSMALLDK